jgi:hypothetical protein
MFSELDKKRANEMLLYGISVLKGNYLPNVKLQIALIVQDNLEELGAWWQAKTLNSHIHRAQRDYKQRIVYSTSKREAVSCTPKE